MVQYTENTEITEITEITGFKITLKLPYFCILIKTRNGPIHRNHRNHGNHRNQIQSQKRSKVGDHSLKGIHKNHRNHGNH